MANTNILSPDVLRQLLRYDPETGKLFWNNRSESSFADTRAWNVWTTRYAGTIAGTKDPRGYVGVRINGTRFWAHRLILCMHGLLRQEAEVDHINGNKSDNRLANLRCCSKSENSRNSKKFSNNKSGICGVRKVGEKWAARAGLYRNGIHIGVFESLEAAAKARAEFNLLNGFSDRHGM